MNNVFSLTDRVAIVTGAGRGIGRGLAVGLAGVGADIVVAELREALLLDPDFTQAGALLETIYAEWAETEFDAVANVGVKGGTIATITNEAFTRKC